MDRRIKASSHSISRVGVVIVILLLGGTVLTACGSSASANARQACQYVNESISQYKIASSQTNPAVEAIDQKKAMALLGSALPMAAIAAGSNGVYQALQATLSEVTRVPEKLLVNALSSECNQILPTGSKQQVPGGYVPPTNIKALS